MNKKRTIVTIIGVILSTALMVGIGLLFASLRDNTIKTTIAHNGSQHFSIQDIEASRLDLLDNNVEIKEYFYKSNIGYASIKSKNDYKPYLLFTKASQGLLDRLELVDGRLPKDETEVVISNHLKTNGGISYKIGDTLHVNLGKRNIPDAETGETEESLSTKEFVEGETLHTTEEKTYKVVGFVERSYLESYSSPGYLVFTKEEKLADSDKVDVYVAYKSPKDIYNKGEALARNLGVSKDDLDQKLHYNDALLSAYGVSRYSNIMDSMLGLVIIVLSLVSIGCIIVIYNSFAISVMERKKQFGLFSSIGATKKQIRHTVFFEAMLVGIIGIPLGILGAIIGIGTVLMIVNQLLPEAFEFALALSIYPTYIIVPVIFMIVVIVLSAFLPAKKASKITPIEAIRQNDDIKIKGKKLKTPKWIRKIFGVEGELALKNIKRNKKKYRITIVSLFISIVLFISFSGLMEYGISASNDMVVNPDFDLQVSIVSNDEKEVQKILDTVLQNEETKQASLSKSNFVAIQDLEPYLTAEAKSALDNQHVQSSGEMDDIYYIKITALDEKSYQKALSMNKMKNGDAIFLNDTKSIIYKKGNRKVAKYRILDKVPESFEFYKISTQEDKETVTKTKMGMIQNVKEAKKTPFSLEMTSSADTQNVIVPSQVFDKIIEQTYDDRMHQDYNIFIKAPTYKNLEKYFKDLEKNNSFESLNYYNVTESMQLQKNMLFVIQLLLYGFITLVTLIGVTSVFNTINTSIALRRKEFAMLRSMGLTPKGFNKILYFESLFFGLKSLLYGIPVSIVITYFISLQVGNMVTFDSFLLPVRSILLAIVGVFIIVFITMMYASAKIKKENILEAIREENI